MHLFRICVRLLLLASALTAAPDAAQIYRCSTEGGGVEFTDRACAGGERTELRRGTGLNLPPLGAEERARLRDLERSASERATDAARAAREARTRARAAERIREACERASSILAEIRATRRRGYRLSEDQALRREEARQREVLGRC
jgi:hypothetical protein